MLLASLLVAPTSCSVWSAKRRPASMWHLSQPSSSGGCGVSRKGSGFTSLSAKTTSSPVYQPQPWERGKLCVTHHYRLPSASMKCGCASTAIVKFVTKCTYPRTGTTARRCAQPRARCSMNGQPPSKAYCRSGGM